VQCRAHRIHGWVCRQDRYTTVNIEKLWIPNLILQRQVIGIGEEDKIHFLVDGESYQVIKSTAGGAADLIHWGAVVSLQSMKRTIEVNICCVEKFHGPCTSLLWAIFGLLGIDPNIARHQQALKLFEAAQRNVQ
jgi:hypothetical protein